MPTSSTVRRSKGNVFADLQVRDADEYFAKAKLAAQILHIAKQRKLTQSATARLLGVNQPKVSALWSGQLDGFSTDRLLRFLSALGCDIEISIAVPRPRRRGRVRVLCR